MFLLRHDFRRHKKPNGALPDAKQKCDDACSAWLASKMSAGMALAAGGTPGIAGIAGSPGASGAPASDVGMGGGSLSEGLLVVYMLVGVNFLFGRMKDFSCEAQGWLASSAWVRHALNFCAVFFMLVIFTRSSPLVPPPALVGVAALICAFFLLMMRCDVRFLAASIALLMALFYVEAMRAYDRKQAQAQAQAQAEQEDRDRALVRVQLLLQGAVLATVAAGCLVYIGQHAREYRGAWSWTTFWFGTQDNKCRGDGSGAARSVARDLRDGARRLARRGDH
jgi:hypothetical protein